MAKSLIDGHHVLYHFLQKELQETDYWLFQMMVARLVASLAIWFSPNTYSAMPILVPFAVRDPDARGNKRKGLADQWGSPDSNGYFRDDNSLIKGLPRPLRIVSRSALYSGHSIGNGFVASHVWRELTPNPREAALASRHPLTYSFVPNLVWLPSQLAKLTDREGSFAQQYLQAISMSLYRDVEFSGPLVRYVDEAWALLKEPVVPETGVPPVQSLSLFNHDLQFVERRKRAVSTVMTALRAQTDGRQISAKVISSRYTDGLNSVPEEQAARMWTFLQDYMTAIDVPGG